MKMDEGLRLLPFEPRVGEDDVEIAVACAGICRTDLHVAAGTIPTARGRVLGHELAGRILAVGERVRRFRRGDRVTVFPIVGCGGCASCAEHRPWRCAQTAMLGVSRQGAFSDRLVVPQRAVFRLPDSLSIEEGAYAEPVAASLAVLDAGIADGARGVVLGRGRIAELTRRVLATRGIDAPLHDLSGRRPAPRSLDFVVETVASEHAFALAVDALRPGGTLVLKSRPAHKVPIDVSRAVTREITLRAVAYGKMEDALALIGSADLGIDDFLGPSFGLEDHEEAFALARRDESLKIFLRPRGDA
jgi:L-iditol 2-dehydrogenase